VLVADSVILHERLVRVLARDDPRVLRLASARTSVRFGSPRETVTLLLDRRPPALADDGEPAEIELTFDDEQAERFMAGALNVPLALLTGEISWRGPVRRYLVVDAVLRSLLREEARDR
jgi:hypothetical protein